MRAYVFMRACLCAFVCACVSVVRLFVCMYELAYTRILVYEPVFVHYSTHHIWNIQRALFLITFVFVMICNTLRNTFSSVLLCSSFSCVAAAIAISPGNTTLLNRAIFAAWNFASLILPFATLQRIDSGRILESNKGSLVSDIRFKKVPCE